MNVNLVNKNKITNYDGEEDVTNKSGIAKDC